MIEMTNIAGFLIIFFAGGLKIILASSHSTAQVDQYQEYNLTTVQIIEKYGYPAETHTTETEDGYILKLHRIPHGKNSTEPGFPVILQHGLLTDSSAFVLFGPNSLAFILSDAGYDVWLTNNRGNHYTRIHRYLSTNDDKFWDFSWHESGIYDLPAQINYICNYTKFDDVLFIGVSMGATEYFVMASEKPETQKKVRAAFMLAPVAYVKHLKSPVRIFTPGTNVIQHMSETFIHGEFPEQGPALQKLTERFCTSRSSSQFICKNLIFLLFGYDYEEFNERALGNFLGHTPSSASTKTLAHYGQLVNSGKFCQYDYGLIKNLAKYKQSTPPEYKLELIRTPMAMFIATTNDYFSNPKDLVSLLRRLSCVKTIDVVPYASFTHLDFLAAKHAKELVYDKLLERMKSSLMQNENP